MYRESLVPRKLPKERPPYIEHETAERFNRNVIKPWFEMRPQERDFDDLYPAQSIAGDLDYVKAVKKDFSPTRLEKATTAEYVMLQGFGDEMWIPDASVMPCSEYDDIAKGVDFVLSFEKDGKFTHLGVDVTIGGLETCEKKLRKIKQELVKGNLKKLKYFEADMPEAGRGRLSLPVVILRVDPFQLRELGSAIAKKPGKRTDLENNMILFLRTAALEEMRNQLTEEIRIIQESKKMTDSKKTELADLLQRLRDKIPARKKRALKALR